MAGARDQKRSARGLDGNLFPRMRIASAECAMPRFYFHIQTIDGLNEEDDVGAVFRSEEDAIRETGDLANQMMLDATKARHHVKHVIEVMDENRKVLARLDCTAAIDAEPSNDGLEHQKR